MKNYKKIIRVILVLFVFCTNMIFANALELSDRCYLRKSYNYNNDVYVLQQMLNVIYKDDILVEDGVFGKNTYNKVIRFQTENYIQVDGVVGPETSRKINEVYNGIVNKKNTKVIDIVPSQKNTKSSGSNFSESSKYKSVSNVKFKSKSLGKGSRGEDVKLLQTILKKYVDNSIDVDGVFGNDTELVLKNFQSRFTLKNDGIADSDDMTLLCSLYNNTYGGKLYHLGNRDEDIKNINIMLNRIYKLNITENEYYSTETRAGVIKFQKEYSDGVDGVLKEVEVQKMRKIYDSKSSKK